MPINWECGRVGDAVGADAIAKGKTLPLAELGPRLDRTFIWEIIGSNVGRRIGYPQWVRGGGGVGWGAQVV